MTDYTKIEDREITDERLQTVRKEMDSDIAQFTEEYDGDSNPGINLLLQEFGNPESIAEYALARGQESVNETEVSDNPVVVHATAWLDGFVTAARLVTDQPNWEGDDEDTEEDQ